MPETKFIQTLYTKSDDELDLLRHSPGWFGPEYHLMSWSLSCLCLREYYDNLHLYCNSPAARILIDELQLPYTEVHVTHDKKDFQLPHPDVWAFPKIHTYSLQDSAFIHLDGDVFIFEEFTAGFLRQPLVAQEPEKSNGYYNETREQLIRSFDYLPHYIRTAFLRDQELNSVCAGILGGTNLNFFQEYAAEAKAYVYRNLHNMHGVDVSKFNVFFEQHLFHALADERQVPITFLIPRSNGEYLFAGLANFWEVPGKRTFLHLLGDYKRKATYAIQLAQMLKTHYPEQYFKVIDLFANKKLHLKIDYYYQVADRSPTGLAEYLTVSKDAFSTNRSVADAVIATDADAPLDKETHFLDDVVAALDMHGMPFTRAELETDLHEFLKKLTSVIARNENLSKSYLYGRDIKAFERYQHLSLEHHHFLNKEVVIGEGVEILTGNFNWGFFLQLFRQSGFIPIIDSDRLAKGEYFAIVIPEPYRFGFLIFDIELLAVAMFGLLEEPRTVGELLARTKTYLDPQLSVDYQEETDRIILELLEALILRKAVMFTN